MNLKVGDFVVVRMNGYYREGVIHDISVGLTTTDVAGEHGVEVKEYDTELGYNGSISYGDNYWAYFDQIDEELTNKYKKKELHPVFKEIVGGFING